MDGQEVGHDTDIEEGLKRNMRGNTGGKQRTETVARVHGDIIAAHNQQNKQQNHDDGPDKTEFLTENGENIVVMLSRRPSRS